MRIRGLGLQGKFIIALLIAAALPFVVGLVAFETINYRHLLAERGKLHQMEALTLANALKQASQENGESLRTWIAADPALIAFVSEQNQRAAAADPAEIARETRELDELWPSLSPDAPQVQAILQNSGSTNLTRYQKLHPDVAEVLVTDASGRLIAATGKTTDVEQSDEAWWQTGASLPNGTVWTDELHTDDSSGVFSIDVVLPLHADDTMAGVAKISVDVTSLFAQLAITREAAGEHWQIVLPDGLVLACSKRDYETLSERLSPETLRAIQRAHNGWAIVTGTRQRMVGFVALGPDGGPPTAYVLFSSLRDDVIEPLQRNFLMLGAAGTALLLTCALIGYYLVHHNILVPLADLGRAARSISETAHLRQAAHADEEKIRNQRLQAEADLAKIQTIRTGDEVEDLADDLAVMTSRVLRYHRELESEVAAKTAVIREDLEMAREFQHALLPSRYPDIPPPRIHNPLHLRFAHFYQPASTVGGDFFDLIELDEHRAGILIADVMGHGARSALITAILRALVKNYEGSAADPGKFLSELNLHLHEVVSRSGQALFVTAFFLVLDTRKATASWAVAGHPSPLRVRRGSGKLPAPLWTKPQRQPALGLVPEASYQTHEQPLHPGEVFLLFTDGAIEAENPEGQIFGPERLANSLDQALDGPMAAMPAKIVCDVVAFQKRQQCDDDICLVAVEAVTNPTAPM